ncbi:MAG TPA: alpha/beta hydrolase [Gaiellaceae bacterium]|nr:alpha/beta hydrolase [Gaiellaceae bacterium]HZT53360.1 alpha/beta hydrolase [Gaiellaceae bacterium]
MPLDPQARAFLDRLAQAGAVAFGEMPVGEARRQQEEGAPALFGPVEEVPFADRSLPGPAGPVPVRVYSPVPEPAPALVYFHGGGWVLGSARTVHGVCATLARRAACAVVSVDYRLAPEHRFPAALDDAWAVTTWVAEHPGQVGGREGLLAVGGDSAGGNLAAVVARRARDAGLALALQLLAYPVLDADFERQSYRDFAEGYWLTRAAMQWFWDQYLPDGDRLHPDASPLRAPDLAGVAPAYVVTAECDVLRDEGEDYARRLESAGVPTTLRRHAGMIHGFLRLPAVLDGARAGLDEASRALAGAFAGRARSGA